MSHEESDSDHSQDYGSANSLLGRTNEIEDLDDEDLGEGDYEGREGVSSDEDGAPGGIDDDQGLSTAMEKMQIVKKEKEAEFAKEKALRLIESDIREAKEKEKPLDRDEFLKTHGDSLYYIMDESANKQNNVLHTLAQQIFGNPDHFPDWIIKHIHEKTMTNGEGETRNNLPKLLTDKANKMPSFALAYAIRWNNQPFIRTILSLDLKEEGQCIKDSLRECVDDKRNCIHWAIDNIDPYLTVQLIEKAAGDECLLTPDKNGYTPLHRAVEYPNCLERLDIIKALLKHGDKALDSRCNKNLSIFRYYQETKATYLKKFQRSSKADVLSGARKSLGKDSGGSKEKKVEPEDVREKEKGNKVDQTKSPKDGEKKDDNAMRNEGAAKAEILGEIGGPKNRLQRTGTGLQEESKLSTLSNTPTTQKMALARSTARNSSVTPSNQNFLKGQNRIQKKSQPRKKEIADEIEDEIKLQYLRSTFKPESGRDVKSVNNFLYVRGKEQPFSLTMLQGPTSVDPHVFTTVYGKEKFNRTMHHVAVRRLILKQTKNKEAGRTDMEILFKLLKEKGVYHIVKVIVFDIDHPPHSDESIETCLSGFKSIEILDWRKVDLCPETILKACPNVVELHLWWSGNNGILMAWSASGGLARLPRLNSIHIHQTQCIESPDRDKENLQRFKDRLEIDRAEEQKLASLRKELPLTVLDIWPSINVNTSDTTSSAHSSGSISQNTQLTQTTAQYRRRHEWLDIMDKFAAGVDLIDVERTGISTEDVRVALIDDGVEITNRSLTDRIYSGWTCDTGYKGNGLEGIPRPYTSSETQHGTFMASTICRICPRAKIFVYRLDVESLPGQRVHFTAKSAADALELAIDNTPKFDIISMSWTIVGNPENEQHLERLKIALDKAYKNNCVLLFCASPDSGEMANVQTRNYYPFGCQNKALFKMAAATVDGIRMSMAGSQFDYSLPGHEVEDSNQMANNNAREVLRSRQATDIETRSLKTGSSIATALGAGLAALIIYCVRLGAAYAAYMNNTNGSSDTAPSINGKKDFIKLNSIVLGRNKLNLIKKPEQMRKVFDRMCNSSGDHYIDVWERFYECGNELEKLGQQIKVLEGEIKELEDEAKVSGSKRKHAVQPGITEIEEMRNNIEKKNNERMMKIVELAVLFTGD